MQEDPSKINYCQPFPKKHKTKPKREVIKKQHGSFCQTLKAGVYEAS